MASGVCHHPRLQPPGPCHRYPSQAGIKCQNFPRSCCSYGRCRRRGWVSNSSGTGQYRGGGYVLGTNQEEEEEEEDQEEETELLQDELFRERTTGTQARYFSTLITV